MEKVTETFADTGETVERKPTVEELAQRKADQEAYKIAKDQELADLHAKTTAKAALLKRLGITADEAALLLG
jgi:hypothetical protein